MEIRTKQFQILTDIELVWQLMTDVFKEKVACIRQKEQELK